MGQIQTEERGTVQTIGGLMSLGGSMQTIVRRDYSDKYGYLYILELMETIGKQAEPRFVIDKSNKFAYTNIAKWLVGDPTMESLDVNGRSRRTGRLSCGIYLCGETGTGKSFIMAIASTIAKELRLGYSYGRAARSLSWYSFRADAATSYYMRSGDLLPWTEENMVCCLNDLGSEPSDANYMGTRTNVLRQIIETRGDNRSMITHFTSNISLRDSAKMKGRYGDRAYDRLRQLNYLEIAGGSRR